MIYFVVRNAVRWGIEDYLAAWGKSMAPRVGILTYEELPKCGELPLGTYIFTQRDDLLPSEVELTTLVWDRLSREPGVRLLNHPSRALGRYDLLRTLHDRGLNDFRVARATEDTGHLRFPVFVREERCHTGSLTDLIRTTSELDQAIGGLLLRGWHRDDLLVVEFCDAADSRGMFRKYSAYVVGTEIIPRGVLFSKQWMVKSDTKTMDEERARVEEEYVEANPHAAWLREVMDLAHIEYGRIDYGLMGQQPQAWEINLYPTLLTPSWAPAPEPNDPTRALRLPSRTLFFQRFETALRALDSDGKDGVKVPITLSDDLLQRLRSDRRRERLRTMHRSAVDRLSRQRLLQRPWRVVRPWVTRLASIAGWVGKPGRLGP